MFNTISLIGRLARENEFKTTNSGLEICENTLALSKKQGGNDKPIYIKIKIFGKACDIMRKYTAKGHKIGIIGELDFNMWDDAKSGGKKSEHSIVVNSIELLQHRDENTTPQRKQYQQRRPSTKPQVAERANADEIGEIPF